MLLPSPFPQLYCVFSFLERAINAVTFGCHVPGAGAHALAGLFRRCPVQSRDKSKVFLFFV